MRVPASAVYYSTGRVERSSSIFSLRLQVLVCGRHARATDTSGAAGDARTALPPTLRAGVEEGSTDGARWSSNECAFHGTGVDLELPPGPPFFRPAAFTSAGHLRGNIIAARAFRARVLFVEPGAAAASPRNNVISRTQVGARQ